MSSDTIEPRSERRSETKVRQLTPDNLGLVEVSTQDVQDLADKTGFQRDEIERWIRAIERKPQIVFYGPPGTGKTFVAKKIANILTENSDGFKETLQFHSSYSYADFIEGIRPVSNSDDELRYPVVQGRFVDFCERAREKDGTCVLILDEINRANLSEVFGELMYLLEYRTEEIRLAQKKVEQTDDEGNVESDDETFDIPENVVLIGTMNTADRSIALVDFALRRRFSFIPMWPSFEILKHFHSDTTFDPEDWLIDALEDIHEAIDDPNFELGHTYFLRSDLEGHIEDIWQLEIEPYLHEYFFDSPETVAKFEWETIEDQYIT